MIKVFLISVCSLAVVPFAQEGARYMLTSSISPSSPPAAPARSPAKERELNMLSNEIESLTNLRDYYVAKMTRYRNKASRLEFQEMGLDESKELMELADKLEGIVEQIEEEIVRLEQVKESLLKGV